MIRYILFVVMIVIGAFFGIFYAREINPVDVVDAPPSSLRADYKADYVLMVAEVYAQEQDPALAARQLALLGSDSPSEIINQALLTALDLEYSPNDLIVMRDLAEAMKTWNPDLEGGS
ncbi:MAG: hypothetical protein P8046_04615 [Anaerolineales bacterium]|jgi:hypothetical protein